MRKQKREDTVKKNIALKESTDFVVLHYIRVVNNESRLKISEAPRAEYVASATAIQILALFKLGASITSHSTYMFQLLQLFQNLVLVLWLKQY